MKQSPGIEESKKATTLRFFTEDELRSQGVNLESIIRKTHPEHSNSTYLTSKDLLLMANGDLPFGPKQLEAYTKSKSFIDWFEDVKRVRIPRWAITDQPKVVRVRVKSWADMAEDPKVIVRHDKSLTYEGSGSVFVPDMRHLSGRELTSLEKWPGDPEKPAGQMDNYAIDFWMLEEIK